jgi:hypothetical protein
MQLFTASEAQNAPRDVNFDALRRRPRPGQRRDSARRHPGFRARPQ